MLSPDDRGKCRAFSITTFRLPLSENLAKPIAFSLLTGYIFCFDLINSINQTLVFINKTFIYRIIKGKEENIEGKKGV